MKKGEFRRLLIPSEQAYKEAGSPPAIPPNSDLVFVIELVEAYPEGYDDLQLPE
jgi:FKBP-type peptidyl-prolyl cis-trans isomerase